MFDAEQFLKFTTNKKTDHSNSSKNSISSRNDSQTYTTSIESFLDLSLPSIMTQPLPYFTYDNTNSNQSLQSIPSTTLSHSPYSDTSSSHTIQLNLSETTLTPNIAAVAMTNLTYDNFSLDTIHTDISNKSIPTSHTDELTVIIESDDSKNDSTVNQLQNTKDDNEIKCLHKHGYNRGKLIATTLQGFIYEIICIKTGKKYVVKQTSKHLHKNKMTIQNGKKYSIQEDILNEKEMLEIICKKNPPEYLIKFVEWFESDTYYYLIMEHGGTDLFQFICQAHEYIQKDMLSYRDWRKFIKYIFWQMCVLLLWLHNTCNATHADVSLENILIQNAKFIKQPNGKISISTNVLIKFCDFGLSEFHYGKHGFKSNKYCGKPNYQSPQEYKKQGGFDSCKADVWSLGVVLFCMSIGSPPYKKPNKNDGCYNNYIKKGHIAQLLYGWKRHSYVTERMLSLVKHMLKYDENQRFTMDEVIKHPWLRTYYSKYYSFIKNDLLANQNANTN